MCWACAPFIERLRQPFPSQPSIKPRRAFTTASAIVRLTSGTLASRLIAESPVKARQTGEMIGGRWEGNLKRNALTALGEPCQGDVLARKSQGLATGSEPWQIVFCTASVLDPFQCKGSRSGHRSGSASQRVCRAKLCEKLFPVHREQQALRRTSTVYSSRNTTPSAGRLNVPLHVLYDPIQLGVMLGWSLLLPSR